ncbi:MAG: carboxypeptidase regulatory-like domain-containing protein [Gemmatimonadota bacterium]|nr:MAG: carboxypeptidase regulatory-like domain-containing protein [Gemmatimonadota bacterium]
MKSMICILTITLLVLWGCIPDAERDNPFDPKSDGYRDEGVLTGTITRRAQPSEGIEGVLVTLDPPQGSETTDRDGFFTMDNIPSGNYVVTAFKTGYSQDSASVQIIAGQRDTVHLALNGVPHFSKTRVTSEHNKSFTGDDVYFFHFDAQVEDADGLSDIDSVAVTVDDLEFYKHLIRESNTNRFSVTIFPEEISETSLEALVGKETIFIVTDRNSFKTESDPQYLVRIIHQSPSTVSPADRDQVDPQPLLVWNQFSAPFAYTYSVEISAFPSVWSWSREGILPSDTSITVNDTLDSRWSYFWLVSIVDEYGNFSQSPRVEFFVTGRR